MPDVFIPGVGTYHPEDGMSNKEIIDVIRESFPDVDTSTLDLPKPEYSSFTREQKLAELQRLRDGMEQQTIKESPPLTGFERFAAGTAALNQGAAQVPSGVLGALGAFEDVTRMPIVSRAITGVTLPPIDRTQPPVLSGFREARKGFDEAVESLFPVDPRAEFRPNPKAKFGQFLKDPNYWNTAVTRGIGQIAGLVALAPMGAPAAVAASTAGEFSDAYERELDRQEKLDEPVDYAKALVKSGAYAAAVGILESKLGVGHLIERFGKPAVEGMVVRIAKQAAAGGSEELLERVIQDAIIDGPKNVNFDAAFQEGVVGAISQGLAGVPGARAGVRADRAIEEQAQDARRKLDAFRFTREEPKQPAEVVSPEWQDIHGAPLSPSEQRTATDAALAKANALLAQEPPQPAEVKEPEWVDRFAEPTVVTPTPAPVAALETKPEVVEKAVDVQKKPAIVEQQRQEETKQSALSDTFKTIRNDLLSGNYSQLFSPTEITSLSSSFDPRLVEINPPEADRILNDFSNLVASRNQKIQNETKAQTQRPTTTGAEVATPSALPNVQGQPTITQTEGQAAVGTAQPPGYNQEVVAQETPKSLFDRIDAQLTKWIDATSFEPGLYSATQVLPQAALRGILKLTQLAFRSGKAIHDAIREAIGTYKKQNPTEQFDDNVMAAEVARLAGVESLAKRVVPIVQEAKEASASLGYEAFQTHAYRSALQTLRDLRDKVSARVLGLTEDRQSAVPDLTDPKLVQMAGELGVPMNANQTAGYLDLQEAIGFERKAQSYRVRADEVALYEKTIANLRKLGRGAARSEDIDYFQTLIDRNRRWMAVAEEAEHNGQTVPERADQIKQANDTQIERQATRNALSLEPVKKAILGPIEAFRRTQERFPEFSNRDWAEVLADTSVPEERKAIFAMDVARQLVEFDEQKKTAQTAYKSAQETLNPKLAKMKEGQKSAADSRDTNEIIISDALRALAGETGLTGNTYGTDWAEWLKSNQSALMRFAERLATRGATDPQAAELLDWLTISPEGAPKIIRRDARREGFGVSDQAMNEILTAVSESPAIRNAVMAMVDRANRRIPYDKLQAIAESSLRAELAEITGDAEEAARLKSEAESMFNKLVKQSEGARSSAAARAIELQDQIDQINLELTTLRKGVEMFERVEQTPKFQEFRQVALQGSSYVQQMVVQNEDEITLRGFSLPGEEINQPAVKASSKLAVQPFADDAIPNIQQWWRNAQAYLTAYNDAVTDWIAEDGPPPASLGFDIPTVRGIDFAMRFDVPLLLEAANSNADLRVHNKRILLQKAGWGWFRQYTATSKLVEGVMGTRFKGAVAAYQNATLMAARLATTEQFQDMRKTRSEALRSHPELENNMELYEEQVYNPMAHEGRKFGSNLKTGLVLTTGKIVTKEDMAFLKQSRAYFLKLLEIAQSRGDKATGELVGGKLVGGKVTGGRELHRAAGSVGDYGMPRHITEESSSSILHPIVKAYKAWRDSANPPPLNALTTLDANSTHPIVQMWNKLATQKKFLREHIHDAATRTEDYKVKISPLMRTAYRTIEDGLANEVGGYNMAQNFNNLEELANALQAAIPPGSGVNTREFVVTELLGELAQIAALSGQHVDGDLRNEQTHLVRMQSITSNNEFTRPRADLIIPGKFYKYGAVNNGDFAKATKRATDQRLIEMGVALASAKNELDSRITMVENGTDPHALDLVSDNQQDALAWARSVSAGLAASIKDVNTNKPPAVGPLKWALQLAGFKAAMALTAPIAAFRNLTLSHYTAWVVSNRINAAGSHAALAWSIMQLPKTWSKAGIRILANLPFAKPFVQWARKHDPSLLKYVVDSAAKVYRWAVLNDIEEVRRIGFSQPHSFYANIGQAWRDTDEYENKNQAALYQGTGPVRVVKRGLRRTFGTAGSALHNLFVSTGLGYTDQMANAGVGMAFFRQLEDQLKKASVRWLQARGGDVAQFDPTSPTWHMTNQDYTGKPSSSESQVGHLREFLNRSGVALDFAAADYMRRSNNGQNEATPFFSKDHEDSVKQTAIADVNASTRVNRPTGAQKNDVQSVFQVLFGYPADFSTKILSVLRFVKGDDKKRRWLQGLLIGFIGLLGSLFFSATGELAADAFRRYIMRRKTRNLTLLDKGFFSADAKGAWRIAKLAVMPIPYIGPALMTMAEEMSGGKGSLDMGSIFLLQSFLSDLVGFGRSLWNLPVEDYPWVINRFVSQQVPFIQVGKGARTYQGMEAWLNGSNAYAAYAQAQGIGDVKSAASSNKAAGFGPKAGMRGKLREDLVNYMSAIERGDTAKASEFMADAQHQRDRLVSYYEDRAKERAKAAGSDFDADTAHKEALASARADYLSLDPAQTAIGRKPTADEHAKIMGAMGDDRRRDFDQVEKAWKAGAELFPNSKGQVVEPTVDKRPRRSAGQTYGALRGLAAPGFGGISRTRGGRRGGIRGLAVRRRRIGRVRGLRLRSR